MLRDAGTRIYMYREIELDSSTGLSMGALLKSNERFDHMTAISVTAITWATVTPLVLTLSICLMDYDL